MYKKLITCQQSFYYYICANVEFYSYFHAVNQKHFFLLNILGLFFVIKTSAQVLDNSQGKAFTDKPFFNQSFIASNKIKTIKGQFNYKKSGKAIYPTNYYYVYNFNKKGELISTFETRKDDGSTDTTWNEYIYNEKGTLIEHKQGTRTGKTVTLYILNTDEQIIGEEYYTESIDSVSKNKKRLLINSESFIVETIDLQQKKTVCNSYGLPYKVQTTHYDQDGYLTELEERFLRTSNFFKKKYTYNEHGWLETIVAYQKGKTEPSERELYKYDKFGNLIEKHYYKDQEFITDTQIIYNDKSKLMSSVIIRDVKTDFLMIIRFNKYEFFN